MAALLSGCTCGMRVGDAVQLDASLAAAGFAHHRIKVDGFWVHAWLRTAGSDTLTIVIEGDGAAWYAVGRPPIDPTPAHSQAAALAAALPGTVAYLARPCQFTANAPACRFEYWTIERFAPQLVVASDEVIDTLKHLSGASRLRLTGHSGGGVMAVLIAQHRQDVDAVVSFMAPLDVLEWTRMHDVTPLVGLDPMVLPAKPIPAVHVAGGRDRIVPANIVRRYVEAKGGKYIEWEQAAHACWPLESALHILEELQ